MFYKALILAFLSGAMTAGASAMTVWNWVMAQDESLELHLAPEEKRAYNTTCTKIQNLQNFNQRAFEAGLTKKIIDFTEPEMIKGYFGSKFAPIYLQQINHQRRSHLRLQIQRGALAVGGIIGGCIWALPPVQQRLSKASDWLIQR